MGLVLGIVGATAGEPPTRPQLLVLNPTLDIGWDIPTAWETRWGSAEVSRDTNTFHSPPAAVRVHRRDVEGGGSAAQLIEARGNLRLKVSGWVKSTGNARVNFAVQSFDTNYTPVGFQPVRFLQGAQDWTRAEQEITLPAQAVRFGLTLLVEGQGTAWLDDVRVTSDQAEVEHRAPDPGPEPPREPEDPKLIPVTATRGYFRDYPKAWDSFHQLHLDLSQQRPIDLVFLGDSITQGWGTKPGFEGPGKVVWDEFLAKHHPVNLGIGGDQTQNILWRVENGELDGISPKAVVLLVGVNNFWSGKNSDEEIAAGIRKVVAAILKHQPEARLLVLGIFPTGEKPDHPLRPRIKAINALSAKMDNGRSVRFLDLGDRFLQPDGTLDKVVMPDFLHLSAKGYRIWAEAMRPVLDEIMK